MVELNTMEKEIQKLLKKMEKNEYIHHLTPTEIHKIINKHGLLRFLRNPKDRHVIWKYAGKVEVDLGSRGSWQGFWDDLNDYVTIGFTGKWDIGS